MTDTPFIDIHTHQKAKPISGCIAVINLFANEALIPEQESNTFYSIGLHPWHLTADVQTLNLENIKQSIKSKAIIAIGETGLDRAIATSIELQKAVFERHLLLAQKFEKPVIIHAVRSFNDIVEIYNKSKVNVKMIFHGFNGNLEIAGQLIRRGFYLSFGADLLNPDKKAPGVFKAVPIRNIFLETDESAISINEIYSRAAEINNMGLHVLKENIYDNFIRCFGKII